MATTIQRQIIAGALSLIEKKENWTGRVLARTSNGIRCEWSDARATKFCAIGALGRTAQTLVGDYFSAKQLALETANIIMAANNQPGWCLSSINDIDGHAAIVRLFRAALENWEVNGPPI
jgi:hypothetical protein